MRKKRIERTGINVLPEITCPVCGKAFIPAAQHIYHDMGATRKRVCSWGCICASERLKAGAKNES